MQNFIRLRADKLGFVNQGESVGIISLSCPVYELNQVKDGSSPSFDFLRAISTSATSFYSVSTSTLRAMPLRYTMSYKPTGGRTITYLNLTVC